ncbi:MAG: cytochrome P460 family protein [Rhizobiaceae bacterium]
MKRALGFGTKIMALGLLLSLLSPAVLQAQEDAETAHIAVKNPADLSQAEANRIYDALKQTLEERYSIAKLGLIDGYQSWKRYNSAPYLSATHGQRFVNNYANQLGADYGKLGEGETYPAGTIFAKDTITVTEEGKNFPGAILVMEKLAAGKSPPTADWRYVMVIPDGTIFGDTIGDEPELVEYCHACHEAVADDDYVFFVPDDYRISP